MKKTITAILLASAAVPAHADVLTPFLDVARPVVVLADTPIDPRLTKQIEVLDAKTRALADYEITVVSVTARDARLRKKLGVPPTGFAVALVGKDGSVKETWREPVDPARIFALIDRMPMRRNEMRNR